MPLELIILTLSWNHFTIRVLPSSFYFSVLSLNLPVPAPWPCRCLYHLLDSWTGLVTPRRVLPAVWRSGLWEVFPSACRVQLCHEPHHLLLPRQGDERHVQADPLLPAQWEHQRPHGRLGPLGFLPQPHHPGWSSQQWPLRGLGKKLRWEAAITYWGMNSLPPPRKARAGSGVRKKKNTFMYLNTNPWQYLFLDPARLDICWKISLRDTPHPAPIPFESRKRRSCNGIHTQTLECPCTLH